MLLGWVWLSSKPDQDASLSRTAKPATPAAPPADWEPLDFSTLRAGGKIPGWTVQQGDFKLVAREGVVMLELGSEPMEEGWLKAERMILSGGIRARMSGEAHRRVAPRFSVSLEGSRPFQLRAAPVPGVLEIVTSNEVKLASMPWQWRKEQKLWLELVLQPDGPRQVRLEGRAWHDDEQRPPQPQLEARTGSMKGRLSPSVRGAPFALRPLFVDRVEVLSGL